MKTFERVEIKNMDSKDIGINEDDDDIDECATEPHPCGLEEGCMNTRNGFKCICHDLLPVDPLNGCVRNVSRNDMMNSTSHSNNSPELGTFAKQQLLNMYSPGNNGSITIIGMKSNINKTFTNNNSSQITPSLSSLSLNLFVPIALIIFTLIITSIGLYCRMRLKNRVKKNTKKSNQPPSAGSLAKCMQHYVTNPNYYSSSHDTPLLKTLKDIEISLENIKFEEEIGNGCFGTVYRGTLAQVSGPSTQVAIKVLKEGASPEAADDFEREVEIMSTFDHENIVKLLGIVIRESHPIPCMVFEYMCYGDLAEVLRSHGDMKWFKGEESTCDSDSIKLKPDISRDDLILIATQVANGMLYLSSQHFVHRDLATRNCLVGENLTVKISDFGMSRDIYTCDYYKVSGSRMLPVRWMAPESILYGKFTLESDVWAFGVLLWEIYTYGRQPYYGHSNEEVVKLILQGILLIPPDDCPNCIYDLMGRCWKTEARNRIDFQTIYKKLIANCPNDKKEHSIKDDLVLDIDNYLVPDSLFSP